MSTLDNQQPPTRWLGRMIGGACLLVAIAGFLISSGGADDSAQQDSSAENAAAPVQRGEYIVHHVAMCVECHSPRDSSGDLIEGRLLTGGRIPVAQPFAAMDWALRPPRLAGLPGWRTEEIVTLLMEGARPGHESPDPPMPPFRLNRDDAEAVVSYLRSLR
jgi:mono/diheme cytochrome c family protein